MNRIAEPAIEKFAIELHENQATNTSTSSLSNDTEINGYE